MKHLLPIPVAAAILLLCLLLPGANSLQAQGTGRLVIKIHPVWQGKALQLSKQFYVTDKGDSLYIDVFKFYISALTLIDDQHKKLPGKNSYHLINAEDSGSLSFTINGLPQNNFKALSLSLGVDSLMNVSGALDGDLDPVKGMYWAWNTGYINAKAEGHCNACKTLHHAFELHIGGYAAPYNTLRKVLLTLPDLKIISNKTTCIELTADLAEWFKNPAGINISKTNSIVIPGKEAMMMADNYADMLSVFKIINP